MDYAVPSLHRKLHDLFGNTAFKGWSPINDLFSILQEKFIGWLASPFPFVESRFFHSWMGKEGEREDLTDIGILHSKHFKDLKLLSSDLD
jgi:hypothetical protein